jgi:hypothetical protein
MGLVVVIVVVIVLIVIFGKKQEWEFEAKLMVEGEYAVVGELEIEKFQRSTAKGELKIYPVPLRVQGDYDIVVNGQRIAQVQYPPGARKVIFEVSDSFRVQAGDHVEVVVPGVKSLKGVFHRD